MKRVYMLILSAADKLEEALKELSNMEDDTDLSIDLLACLHFLRDQARHIKEVG